MRRKRTETMGPMLLADLVAPLQAVQKLNWANGLVQTLTDDSRQVEPGTLFVAVPGEEMDGHKFISEALRRGAGAILCQKLPRPIPPCPVIQVPDSRAALSCLASVFHGRPSESLCVVGVTGTDGKTTTTELCRAVLTEAGHRTGCLGTVKYDLGDRALESVQTTPHPLLLHAVLRDALKAGVTHLCMEVSSHALVHQRTAHVQFDAAVLTNVTEDHLDFHGSPKAYARAKQQLFEQLPETALAILNADSPACDAYRRATSARVLRYGLRNSADMSLDLHSATMEAMELTVCTPDGSYPVRTPLTGDYNCENILAAAALAFAFGLPPEPVQRALAGFRGVPGRMEKIRPQRAAAHPTVVVDYAHTPNALDRSLKALRKLTTGKLICVFGCGGNRERQKRPAMGRIATSLADLAIVTSDNSRDEPTEQIIAEIVSGVEDPQARYVIEPDRRAAIELAIEAADSPDDLVAVCGRGCERIQMLAERRIPFDDRIVVREILERRPYRKKRCA